MSKSPARRVLNPGLDRFQIAIALAAAIAQFATIPICHADVSGEVKQHDDAPSSAWPVSGRIVFGRTSKIATLVYGRIASLPVLVGDHVKKDDVIAEIDTEQLQSNLAVAKAELADAKSKLSVAEAQLVMQTAIRDRLAKLKQSAAFLPSRFEDANNLVSVAAASVDAAKSLAALKQAEVERQDANIRLAIIRAPFNGMVVNYILAVGELASEQAPHILILIDDSAPEIEIIAPIDMLGEISPGLNVTFSLKSGQYRHAKVRAVLPNFAADVKHRIVRLVPQMSGESFSFSDGQPVTVYLPNN